MLLMHQCSGLSLGSRVEGLGGGIGACNGLERGAGGRQRVYGKG